MSLGVWFCGSKGKQCIYRSYVIDVAHLQYRLSAPEGDVAQKWSGSMRLNAWNDCGVFWYRNFYWTPPTKQICKIRDKSPESLCQRSAHRPHVARLNVFSLNFRDQMWVAADDSPAVKAMISLWSCSQGQFLHVSCVCVCVCVGDLWVSSCSVSSSRNRMWIFIFLSLAGVVRILQPTPEASEKGSRGLIVSVRGAARWADVLRNMSETFFLKIILKLLDECTYCTSWAVYRL